MFLDNLLHLLLDGIIAPLIEPEKGDGEDNVLEYNLSTTESGVHQPDAQNVFRDKPGEETVEKKKKKRLTRRFLQRMGNKMEQNETKSNKMKQNQIK